ncbi:MAG: Fic family protein [Candidatus Omnitrophota bacterium]
MKYIHQLKTWPKFTWDLKKISTLLGPVRNHQGRLTGSMEALGFNLKTEAVLKTLTLDIVKSSEIEGEVLDLEQVRSSVANKLGLNVAGLIPSDRYIDSIVEMMLDASLNYDKSLTKDRLLGWHASLFPSGRSGMHKVKPGAWRDDKHGPMKVVSGAIGHERTHFEAPAAERLNDEIKFFLKWFNSAEEIDPVIKAGIAHLWFVTLHPFDDGNGRIARAITDMQLARSDESRERFYSMSAQIRRERKAYYDILEKTQKNVKNPEDGINITGWLEWFLLCLDRALDMTEQILSDVFRKARFWEYHASGAMNERQRLMLNKLLDDFQGKLTSSKWARLTKCSQDTAIRDITDLVEKGVLIKDPAGGRSTSYSLKDI